jgi:hypothetical protein
MFTSEQAFRANSAASETALARIEGFFLTGLTTGPANKPWVAIFKAWFAAGEVNIGSGLTDKPVTKALVVVTKALSVIPKATRWPG